jgi:hypothetical protein
MKDESEDVLDRREQEEGLEKHSDESSDSDERLMLEYMRRKRR